MIYSLYDNNLFENSFLTECLNPDCYTYNLYPFISFSLIKILNVGLWNPINTISFLVLFVNLVAVQFVIGEFTYRVFINRRKSIIMFLLSILLNITFYSNIFSRHLAYSLAVYLLLSLISILLLYSYYQNFQIRNKYILVYIFYVTIVLLITHPISAVGLIFIIFFINTFLHL